MTGTILQPTRENILSDMRKRIFSLSPENFPEELTRNDRWTVFEIPGTFKDDTTLKLNKFIRNCDGSNPRRKEDGGIIKGSFSRVMKTCAAGNGRYAPAYWFEKSDGCILIDVDDTNPNDWPNYESYSERSIGSGYHCIGFFSGECPKNDNGVEYYTEGRWCVMTGDIIEERSEILCVSLSLPNKEKGNNTSPDKQKKEPFVLPDAPLKAGNREPAIHKLVWSLCRKNLGFDSILSAVLSENKTFNPPHPEDYVKKKVRDSWQAYQIKATKKTEEPKVVESRPFTEVEAAEDFVGVLDGDAVWNISTSKWHVWSGKNWETDNRNEVRRRCMSFVRELFNELGKVEKRPDREASYSDIEKLNSKHGIEAVTSLAGILLTKISSDFDTDPLLLNVQNGTIVFSNEKGKGFGFRPHEKTDMCSRIAGCEYIPGAPVPQIWLDHIGKISCGDAALARSIQILLGYSLMGGNPQERIVIAHGGGRNGKSVTFRIVQKILGGYSVTVNPNTLMVSGNKSTSPERLKMRGARLILAQEANKASEEGHAKDTTVMDSGFLKAASGKDPISARNLYSNNVEEFCVTGLVALCTNPLPTVNDRSVAFWERLVMIPFDHFFKPDERDSHIEEKFAAVLPGILNWLLEGWVEYNREEKLPICDAMKGDLVGFKNDGDDYCAFVTECIEEAKDANVKAKELYDEYESWSRSRHLSYKQEKEFGRDMGIRFPKKRTNTGNVYLNIRIKTGQQAVT